MHSLIYFVLTSGREGAMLRQHIINTEKFPLGFINCQLKFLLTAASTPKLINFQMKAALKNIKCHVVLRDLIF